MLLQIQLMRAPAHFRALASGAVYAAIYASMALQNVWCYTHFDSFSSVCHVCVFFCWFHLLGSFMGVPHFW